MFGIDYQCHQMQMPIQQNGYNSAVVYVEQQTTWIPVVAQCSFQEVQDPLMSQDAWNFQAMVSDEVSFESTSTYRPVDPPTEDKYKTRLCVNFAKGGSRNCRYGGLCKFIHPSDTELYAQRFLETEEFAQLKQGHQDEVQRLHVMKKTAASRKEELEMEDLINCKVRQFNLDYPKGLNYYDLHGMTTRGAEEYVLDIISFMKLNQVHTSWIETGRGNHSTNNFPAIRTLLLQHYHGQNGCSFVPLVRNDGVLELTVY